jgi:integrase
MALSKVWIFQKHVKKYGEKEASWYIGFYDPDGKRCSKSCGPGVDGKKAAFKLARKVNAQLIAGTFQAHDKTTWDDFRREYEAKVAEGMDYRNRQETIHALDQFERLIKPKRIGAVTTRTIADFVARRRTEPGQKRRARPGSTATVSPATVNKELRHLRAVLRKAWKWEYLPKDVDFEFLKEPGKLPTYIPPDDFAAIYHACDQARLPRDQSYPAADWWKGLLMTGYMTGWRIGAMLALRREDVDLEKGTALTRAEDNKGKRDQIIHLHPVVIEHLRRLPGFCPVFFPWNYRRSTIFTEFARIQEAADVKPAAGDKVHFGFHDLRRAFATMNADKLTPDALQVLMQHKDYQTTQRYINMARQLNPAVQSLFVPDVNAKPRKAQVGN